MRTTSITFTDCAGLSFRPKSLIMLYSRYMFDSTLHQLEYGINDCQSFAGKRSIACLTDASLSCSSCHSNGFRLVSPLCRCIVSAASGRGVFDGNVRVGQAAQKTDAQQLSRNLLLVPRATVNVKPNLQIIADDVKCSHGCAVSDLEEDQMFYFRYVVLQQAFACQGAAC
jgi:hypothetical protein